MLRINHNFFLFKRNNGSLLLERDTNVNKTEILNPNRWWMLLISPLSLSLSQQTKQLLRFLTSCSPAVGCWNQIGPNTMVKTRRSSSTSKRSHPASSAPSSKRTKILKPLSLRHFFFLSGLFMAYDGLLSPWWNHRRRQLRLRPRLHSQ